MSEIKRQVDLMAHWLMAIPNQVLSVFFGRDDRENTLRALLIRATSGSFLLRIGSRGLGFATSAVLARALSLDSFGVYTYAASWILVLTIPSLIGLDQLLVREMAVYRTRDDWRSAKGLLYFANGLNLGLSLLMALIVAVIALATLGGASGSEIESTVLERGSTAALYAIWIAALIIPFDSTILLQISVMRGLHKIVLGQIPNLLVRPILFVMLIGGVALMPGDHLTAAGAMGLRILIAVIVLVLSLYQVLKQLPGEIRSTAASFHDLRKWLGFIPPLLWLGIVNMINARADFLIMGMLLGAEEVALYGAAYMLAQLVTMFLGSANLSLAPTFAQIYASGDRARLQRVAVKSARAITLVSAPIALGLLVFGKLALRIYGTEYTQAYSALTILAIGQFINMAAGSVGILLTMTGHERFTAVGRTIGAVFNVTLNLLLIPRWGIVGAAWANTINLFLWNALLITFAWRKLGIHTTALGAPSQ